MLLQQAMPSAVTSSHCVSECRGGDTSVDTETLVPSITVFSFSYVGQTSSSILLEAKGRHVIQFWPIKHEQKFTEQPLGMAGFPGRRDKHERLCPLSCLEDDTQVTAGLQPGCDVGVGEAAARIIVMQALTSELFAEGHSSHLSLRRNWLRLPEAWFSVTCSQKHSLHFKY